MTDCKKNDKYARNQLAAKFQYGSSTNLLPPIGVFWDIENCQVPKGRSATALVQNIRERFFKGHREAEFMCVCDISKESREVIHELNMSQVTVVHINATSKNAADDKLKQCMRRFVDVHGSPSTVVLISSDVNFSTDLSDFRHRRKVTVILIHTDHAPEPLLACAHQHFKFEDLTCTLPYRSPMKGQASQTCELVITELPLQRDSKQLQHRLRQLSDNCGGRVLSIVGSTAILRFPNHEAAQRARKRMDKEDVYGSKISVSFANRRTDTGAMSPHGRGSRKSRSCSSSSREPSPVISGSEESTTTGSVNKKPLQSVSDSFIPSEGVKNDPLSVSEAVGSRENLPFAQKQGVFENKKNRTPQKNIGRVSPFMKSDSATKRDVDLQANPAFVRELVPRLSDGSDSPSILYSSSPVLHGHVYSWAESSFRPIEGSGTSPCHFDLTSRPVELLVTNLDQNIETNEMKKILLAAFREHVMVLHISMLVQPDGSLKAMVKVPSTQDAQYSISQLHRKKIGFKRILISYISSDRIIPLHILKAEVLALLVDIPAKRIPLFTFRDLFESRYHRVIGIPDLYKLQDVVVILEDSTGRMVSLNPEYRSTPSPVASEDSRAYLEHVEKSYCERHYRTRELQGWAETMESVYPLPDVHISLKTLSPRVHTLLDSHQGSLPLNSFCTCYEAEFGSLPVVAARSDSQSAGSSCSVPLEHLIACIPGVQITQSSLGIKKIQWLENKTVEEQQHSRCISPALVGQLLVFGKEMVELLKSQSGCTILFSKFIPTYHHHFGRQCRVADYGFTKLLDLFQAVAHIVQVMGQGQNRTLTLTHRYQVKRFAGDLQRTLKSAPGKQVTLSDFSRAYEQSVGRPLDISHYGVCCVTDMLAEVSGGGVVVSTSKSGETLIALPKREQTQEEAERTEAFGRELVELLRHTPACSMPFNGFVPIYHHHFGRQCRLADYGFAKLVELFEAMPDIVEVQGSGEERTINLTQEEKLKMAAERIGTVVRSSSRGEVRLDLIPGKYARMHGRSLAVADFGCSSLHQLVGKMNSLFKLKQTVNGPVVTAVDCGGGQRHLSQQVCQLLMEMPQGRTTVENLCSLYLQRFKTRLDLSALGSMQGHVLVENNWVQLTPRQMFARDVLTLLAEHGGQLSLQSLESSYAETFGAPCLPSGFGSLCDLLQSFPEYLLVRGRRGKKVVALNHDSADFLLPRATAHRQNRHLSSSPLTKRDSEPERLLLSPRPPDLLSQPIPSNLPSPEIQPEAQPFFQHDLMGFESPVPSQRELICDHQEELLLLPPLHFTPRVSLGSRPRPRLAAQFSFSPQN